MTAFAVIATLLAIAWSLFVAFANAMRSTPGGFVGGGTLIAAWGVVAAIWLAALR